MGSAIFHLAGGELVEKRVDVQLTQLRSVVNMPQVNSTQLEHCCCVYVIWIVDSATNTVALLARLGSECVGVRSTGVLARVWHVIECVRVTFPRIVQQFPLARFLFGFFFFAILQGLIKRK